MRLLLSADPFVPVPPLYYGGIERIVDALGTHLQTVHGLQVGLLAHGDSQMMAAARYSWPCTNPRGPVEHLRNAAALRRAAQSFEPDLIHSYSRLFYLLASGGLGIPSLMSYQRAPSLRTTRWARRLLGRVRFTGCSGYIAALGSRGGGRWRPIPNFVDCRRYTSSDRVPADAPLVFLSRVESIKGAHWAIKIARGSGRKLVIAGNRAESGAEADYFESQVAPALGPDIEYVGVVDDQTKAALLAGAAAMVVPIQWDEPFGIVFVESLACGTPVITCPRGATPEIVIHGEHGFLISSVKEGVEAIKRIDSISRSACRQRAESHFDVAIVAQQYLAEYRALVTNAN